MVDKGYTVKELMEFCKQEIANGNGDKHIQISGDDEGNSFHSLFYGFTSSEKELQYYLNEYMMPNTIKSVKDFIILG